MRVRLRPAYTPAELTRLYARPHEHRRFHDHLLRVDATIAVAKWMHLAKPLGVVADLSCGDATIAKAVSPDPILGDFAPGYRFQGPIEVMIDQIPHVDLFICSETIEHLDDPDLVLAKIRAKTDALVLSTPIGERTDENPEHYWGWDVEDVDEMLHAAGFVAHTRIDLTLHHYPYDFQIWGCR